MIGTPLPRPLDEATERLRRYDALPFSARMRAIAVLARELPDDGYAELHARLDAGPDDDRHTGLFLAVVRRDSDRVVRALADPLLRAGHSPPPDGCRYPTPRWPT